MSERADSEKFTSRSQQRSSKFIVSGPSSRNSTARRRLLQHQRMLLGDLEQDRLDLLGIGVVGHADRHLQPAGHARVGAVQHRAGDQVASSAG